MDFTLGNIHFLLNNDVFWHVIKAKVSYYDTYFGMHRLVSRVIYRSLALFERSFGINIQIFKLSLYKFPLKGVLYGA